MRVTESSPNRIIRQVSSIVPARYIRFMNHRHPVIELVPLSAWIALAAMIGLAFVPGTRALIVFVALYAVAAIIFQGWQVVVDLRAQAKAAPAPSTIVVQPEGPSFQEVLRAIPDPVLIVAGHEPDDITGRWIVFANAAAEATFELGAKNNALVGAIRNPEVLECVDEALFGGIAGTVDFETTGGARDQFWRAFSSPLPVDSEVQKLALLVLRDETDTRRMERMRADFLANASHELRTPLASITGFVETLRGSAKDDEKARDKFLGIMAGQADRMGRLINDLLSLSRIEMSEHVAPSGEADLAMVVNDVADSLTLIAREKDVRMMITAPRPGLYPIIGDRDQIVQVVQNLVDNALKYAPRGSQVSVNLQFDMSLSQALECGDGKAAKLVLLRPDRNVHDYYARITVRDEGPGIRREFLPRLAERFYRVEGQKSGDRLGTGLGLAIVKHIVNRHRGGLSVESQGQVAAEGESGLERGGMEMESRVTTLGSPPPTFTAFTAWFPQKGFYNSGIEGPRLVSQTPLKDAG